MLLEQLREVARMADTAKQPEDYRAKLGEAERSADALRAALSRTTDDAVVVAVFKQVSQSCTACHKTYRNQ